MSILGEELATRSGVKKKIIFSFMLQILFSFAAKDISFVFAASDMNITLNSLVM